MLQYTEKITTTREIHFPELRLTFKNNTPSLKVYVYDDCFDLIDEFISSDNYDQMKYDILNYARIWAIDQGAL